MSPVFALTLLLNITEPPVIVALSNAPTAVDQHRVDELWEFVQTLCGRKVPPPVVYFTREEEPPTSPPFLAFYYEHTRVLRISPEAVKPRNLAMGYVYLVMGHEMLHYALVDRRPVEEHHCLFARDGLEQRIADYLVSHEIAHPFLRAMPLESRCEAEMLPHRDAVHGSSSHQAN
ncbi:MAG TPA: hypothetical protein VKA01_09315 [Vicinamibacteria bacterium]|nr:hypothetical protein [Vicinamibacteria bacterium]